MPRVPYLSKTELNVEGRQIFDEVLKTRGGRMSNLNMAMFVCPPAVDLVEKMRVLPRQEGRLNDVFREISSLAILHKLKSTYDWQIHMPISKRMGIRPEVISAIESGDTSSLRPDEAVIIDFTNQLYGGGEVKDSTYDSIVRLIGVLGVIYMIMNLGYYFTITTFANLMKIDPE